MKTIIANWKANPASFPEARDLFVQEVAGASRHASIKTVICPPFVYLAKLFPLLQSDFSVSTISTGVQDMGEFAEPFTGKISLEAVRHFGARYALVGHSDRRYILGEDDEMINRKLKAALSVGIIPVLLVGEKERDDYREDVLAGQLLKGLTGLDSAEVKKVLVVYEPVWAISTRPDSQPDTPASALAAVNMIKEIISKNWKLDQNDIPVLYGGSVNEHNILNFMERPEIGGAVVGGASLNAEKFEQILALTEMA